MFKPVLIIDTKEIEKTGLTIEQFSEKLAAAGSAPESFRLLEEMDVKYKVVEKRPGVTDAQLEEFRKIMAGMPPTEFMIEHDRLFAERPCGAGM